MEKIELEVIAISHSLSQAHSYAVVLGEVVGPRRLPIVIGAFEAQSIALAHEKMTPTRPLTHDLIKNLCVAMGIEITEIVINNLEDGIFYAQLICKYGEEVLEIDSRTSDALALALRFECPIFTYDFILDQAGVEMEESGDEFVEKKPKKTSSKTPAKASKKENLSDYTSRELDELLKAALDKEEYERAIAIRDEISNRKKGS